MDSCSIIYKINSQKLGRDHINATETAGDESGGKRDQDGPPDTLWSCLPLDKTIIEVLGAVALTWGSALRVRKAPSPITIYRSIFDSMYALMRFVVLTEVF